MLWPLFLPDFEQWLNNMMTEQKTSVIHAGGRQVSSEEIFACLHRRGQLLPLFRGVAIEAMLEVSAREVGLSVSDQELQVASESFRRQLGLLSSQKTMEWLNEEKLSIEQFERRVELDVLIEKFKDHLLERYGQQHYAMTVDSWTPVKLRRLVVSSLNEAREICLQIQEDGADFAELAVQHSRDAHARQTGGDMGVLVRKNLTPEVRETIFSTKAGLITAPTPGPDGYEIYLVEEFPTPAYDAMTQAAVREELFREFISLKLRDVKFLGPHFSASISESVNTNAQSGTPAATSDF
ncbi:MAG: peptidylprolyl isomerase [Planctomycetaceae bacterium]